MCVWEKEMGERKHLKWVQKSDECLHAIAQHHNVPRRKNDPPLEKEREKNGVYVMRLYAYVCERVCVDESIQMSSKLQLISFQLHPYPLLPSSLSSPLLFFSRDRTDITEERVVEVSRYSRMLSESGGRVNVLEAEPTALTWERELASDKGKKRGWRKESRRERGVRRGREMTWKFSPGAGKGEAWTALRKENIYRRPVKDRKKASKYMRKERK